MHLSPKSLLELFSPRRVAAMAALAMRPRLPLPRAACFVLQPASRCSLLPPPLAAAPCRRLLLQPQLAAA